MRNVLGSKLLKTLIAMTLIHAVLACEKKPEETDELGSTASITAADLAGSHDFCHNIANGEMGADLNGFSYLKTLTHNADNTYSLTLHFFDNTNCATGGGQNIFTYSSAGAFAVGDDVPTVGASAILYTVGTSVLTMYDNTWAGYFNNAPGCMTNFGAVPSTETTIGGKTCAQSGSGRDFVFGQFPANATEFYDIVAIDDAKTTLSVSTPVTEWMNGQYSSFPTSLGLDYTF